MKKENKTKKNYDKGQIFVKVMAAILAFLVLLATASSLIYSIIF